MPGADGYCCFFCFFCTRRFVLFTFDHFHTFLCILCDFIIFLFYRILVFISCSGLCCVLLPGTLACHLLYFAILQQYCNIISTAAVITPCDLFHLLFTHDTYAYHARCILLHELFVVDSYFRSFLHIYSFARRLSKVVLYLCRDVFMHGWLYVGLSRGRKPADIRILTTEDRIFPYTLCATMFCRAVNVVYSSLIPELLDWQSSCVCTFVMVSCLLLFFCVVYLIIVAALLSLVVFLLRIVIRFLALFSTLLPFYFFLLSFLLNARDHGRTRSSSVVCKRPLSASSWISERDGRWWDG